ncbi:uncharacterized protein BDZ99DRAFT_480878 [Mytilinidion resinicola]|uniref:Uncharacterized protein n=1 Tax=Mytilinidion resinicola TaxID=574789 RepID=A0A6A6YA53_9PEZI|nr:uncharacterized protein BDZ99DRAFT_480878 [Mytilinidion resinicola]KAF2804874.1 hypothetical protein BDZ99DRAFT_480878 [Mytilinidion resinicola]
MADALCGPANPLQNFQKHTAADRTLQQDRLISRQSPSQSFRSTSNQNVGLLDPEFDAFQAGHAPPPHPDFQHLPPHLAHAQLQPRFSPQPQAGGWASDFQRLQISSPQPQQNHHFRPQASAAQSSWHQDFVSQQAPGAAQQAYQPPAQNMNMYGGMPGYGMGGYTGSTFGQSAFGRPMQEQNMSVAEGKQKADIAQFDESAFERAFAEAQAEVLQEEAAVEKVSTQLPAETDPILLGIRDKRYPVYLTMKLRSLISTGATTEAEVYLSHLEQTEQEGTLFIDISEAKWCIDTLDIVANRQHADIIPEEIETRVAALIQKINGRLMSMYPADLAISLDNNWPNLWADLEAAGYITHGRNALQPLQQEHGQQPRSKEQTRNEQDQMAQTAGKLLESVADNTSEKFQKSTFLELMRRLRDHEVRVEGDKVVETNSIDTTGNRPNSSGEHIPPAEQDLDIGRDFVSTINGHEPDLDAIPDSFSLSSISNVKASSSFANGCFFRRDGQLV